MRLRSFFLLSACLHIAVVAVLYWQKKEQAVVNKSLQVEIVTEKLKTSTKSSGQRVAGHRSGPTGAGKKANRDAGREAYFPKYQYGQFGSTGQSFDDAENYRLNPLRDNPQAEWGAGSGTFERIEEFSLMSVLYQKIDGSLSYPGVLARNRIMGTVNARLVFGQQGNCDWKHTQIRGTQAYLQLYVMDVLKRVCTANYSKHLGKREITNVDLSFKFDINENNDWERVASEKVIIGNTLLFYRNSHQSIAEWEFGPFKGMFPVPTIYLNIPWIQENWDRIVNQRDPLKEFKKQFGEG